MVKVPGSKEEQDRLGLKAMEFIRTEYDRKVTARFVDSPEVEGAPVPGFLYNKNNSEDIAIALLKQGILKVDKDSEYAKYYPEKFQKYLEAESTAKKRK